MTSVAGEGPLADPGADWEAAGALRRGALARRVRHRPRGGALFLAQVVLQPVFMLFVFGKVLATSATHGATTVLLLPRRVAFTAMLTALQSTAFPLVIEFCFTKEIEDRLLAPIPRPWWPSRRWCSRRCGRLSRPC